MRLSRSHPLICQTKNGRLGLCFRLIPALADFRFAQV